jgi:hypothetical protein
LLTHYHYCRVDVSTASWVIDSGGMEVLQRHIHYHNGVHDGIYYNRTYEASSITAFLHGWPHYTKSFVRYDPHPKEVVDDPGTLHAPTASSLPSLQSINHSLLCITCANR